MLAHAFGTLLIELRVSHGDLNVPMSEYSPMRAQNEK
jgi:hypothetical protein